MIQTVEKPCDISERQSSEEFLPGASAAEIEQLGARVARGRGGRVTVRVLWTFYAGRTAVGRLELAWRAGRARAPVRPAEHSLKPGSQRQTPALRERE